MHHPPTPILHHRKMRTHSPEKSRTIEQRDSSRRQKVESYQRSRCAFFLKRRNRSSGNQEKPQEQTKKKCRLPYSAQVHVFVALMPKPKPETTGQLVHDRKPLPGH